MSLVPRFLVLFLMLGLAVSAPAQGWVAGSARIDGPDANRAFSAEPRVAELPSLRDVVRKVSPSVVNISTTRQIRATSPQIMLRGDPFFFGNDLFHRFFEMPQHRSLTQSSLGSGVIVSEDGYILTNNHVVQGATQITATLMDGRTFEAEIVGTDAPTDVAVLKIEGEGLVAAEVGDSEVLEVGDWVLAVGNPFGFGHTVTTGIVSAKGRSGVGVTQYEDFIQTDAAINPGNSGGPLVDLAGRVVGINTAIASRTGGAMGIGFAVPANMAGNVMANLIEHGRVDRGWLGVYIQDLDDAMAESFAFVGDGVLLTQVVEGGPAEAAGLREGDIVTHVDGKPMTTANTLATTIATLAAGTEVELDVFRSGRVDRVIVTIGRAGGEPLAHRDSALRALGLSLETVTPELARRHDLAVVEGALVTEVEPAGLAARLGIRPGDVIIGVGDERVPSAEALHAALAEQSLADGIRMLVDSNGRRRFVLVQQRG